jgi:hypothetical protein
MEGRPEMLEIRIGAVQEFDDSTQEFVMTGGVPLQLEHSLVSLSKWESIHEKPFLATEDKTEEEIMSYVQCMIVSSEYPADWRLRLSKENVEAIDAYISKKMTATWFREAPGAPRTREVITSELIYYWMTVFNIPFSCDQWNLNRLFTLIRVCDLKNSKPKKMSRAEAAAQQRDLNAQRRAALKTKG